MPPNAPLNPADHQNGLSLGAYWSATVHAQWLANDKGWTGPLHTPSPNPCRTWVPPPGLENTPSRCFVCVCGWCFPEIRLGLYMFGSCHLYLFWDNMILFLFVPSWWHSYLKNKDYTRQYQVIEILLLRLMIPNSFIYPPVSQGIFLWWIDSHDPWTTPQPQPAKRGPCERRFPTSPFFATATPRLRTWKN